MATNASARLTATATAVTTAVTPDPTVKPEPHLSNKKNVCVEKSIPTNFARRSMVLNLARNAVGPLEIALYGSWNVLPYSKNGGNCNTATTPYGRVQGVMAEIDDSDSDMPELEPCVGDDLM